MAADEKSFSSQHKRSTAVNTENQSKRNEIAVGSAPSYNMSKESSSSYIPSNSEVAKSLKQTLQNEFDIDSTIRKNKLDNSEEKLMVVDTVNNNAPSICIFKSLVGRLVKLAESVDPSYGTCEDTNGDSPIARKRFKVVNEFTLTLESNLNNSNTKESKVNNIGSSKNNDLQLCMYNNAQTSTKSVDVIEPIEYEQENNINEVGNEISVLNVIKNSEAIESNRGSHDDSNVSDDDSCVFVDESENDDFMKIIESIKQNGNKPATSELLQLFHQKDNLPKRWTTFLKYKIIEYLTLKDIRGVERSEVENFNQKNIIWRKKWESINKSLDDLRNLVYYRSKNLPNTTKNQMTLRSVSLQAELCSINEDGQPSEPLRLLTPLNKSVSSPINISSDDEIVLVDTEESNKSISNTSEVNIKRKHSSSSITSNQLMVSTTKVVPPAIPIDASNNISTNYIDLTENDEIIEAPSRLKSDITYKIIKCSTTNTCVPATISTQLTKNLPIQAPSKNVTFIEIPNLPTSSNYFLKTTSATGSNQLPTISSLKTVNSSLQHFAIKSSGKPLPTNLSPIVDSSQLQPRKNVFDQRKILLTQQTKKPIKCTSLTTMSQPSCSKTTNFQPAEIQQTSLLPTKTQHISSQFSKPQSIGSHQLEPLQPAAAEIPIVTRPQINNPPPLPSVVNPKRDPSLEDVPLPPVLSIAIYKRFEVLLDWDFPKFRNKPPIAKEKSFQLFFYHVKDEKPSTENWKLLCEMKTMDTPMGCIINRLILGDRYYFAVRAVDVYNRIGPFSYPRSVVLN